MSKQVIISDNNGKYWAGTSWTTDKTKAEMCLLDNLPAMIRYPDDSGVVFLYQHPARYVDPLNVGAGPVAIVAEALP